MVGARLGKTQAGGGGWQVEVAESGMVKGSGEGATGVAPKGKRGS